MGMMIHRNKKKKEEKKSALVKNAENPESYTAETPEEQRYTKTDINRMNKDDLISLSMEVGIDNASEISGAELKKLLIEKFAL